MRDRLPLLIAAVTLLIVFYRLFLGEVLFWGLPALQFYPWREYMGEMLRAGQLPLWNPYNGAGAPLIANYQSGLFYPLNWPQFVSFLPLATVMSLTAALHLFVAVWGMYHFTGRLGLPLLGRGVSALAFGLGSYLAARVGTFPAVAAAAWMPWVLWAALGVLTEFRRRNIAALALAAGLQLLAGHAQTTWYSMLLVGLFCLFYGLRFTGVREWRRLALVIGGLSLGVGIAAIQLLPTAELLRTSQRSGGVDYDFAMNFSYAPARVLNFLSPDVFGNPGDGTYITEGAFFEDAVYIGLLPLISAFAAVMSWIRHAVRAAREKEALPLTDDDPNTPLIERFKRDRAFQIVPFWLAIAVIGFVFALGQNTPVFPFLFRSVPTFSLFQAPVRWHLWTVFALSVLAGIGTQVWGRGKWLFFGTRLAVAGSIGAAALALFIAPRFISMDSESGVGVLINAVVYTGILGGLAGALTLLQPDRNTPRYDWWALGVLLFVAVDLGWAIHRLNPTVPAAFYERMLVADRSTERGYWAEETEREVMFERFLQFKDYRVAAEDWQAFRASQLPNLNLLDRQYLLNNFDPLRVGHFAAYIDLIETPRDHASPALYQSAATNTVFQLLRPPDKLGKEPAPRAWFVENICWHPDEESLKARLLADWQPYRQVNLVGEGACPEVSGEINPLGEVLTIEDGRNWLEIQVQTETGGLLVLADTDYPGWTATVDGQPARILRVNLAFRAVEVPAGAQIVRFEYRPGWLLPGVLVSVVSLLITALLFRSQNPR